MGAWEVPLTPGPSVSIDTLEFVGWSALAWRRFLDGHKKVRF